ncbi:single-stranded DNA-binding protein [Salibacter halophilus]|uniref:Single-stranded DNA-binding protein n=1 Tax=Salibacter halophilus TaxID=1803916 RepID=A0A6N6M9A6_9FLAO|nr:single-stranded DNA-binding protein [Salibacter halophilus]KAB1065565.1 single-stranded DNA-binding protein [Salibacter halophilus]
MNGMVNKVQLIGNLGADPEIKEFEKDRKMARMSIATNEHYRNGNNEKVTNTTWHNVVAWGSLANIAEKYIKKGSEVVIEGKLNNRSWEDKDGNKRYATEVVANEVLLLDKKKDQ